jgi:hypothetical protein
VYEAHGEGKEYQAAKELYIAARDRFSELQSLKRSEVFETTQTDKSESRRAAAIKAAATR